MSDAQVSPMGEDEEVKPEGVMPEMPAAEAPAMPEEPAA